MHVLLIEDSQRLRESLTQGLQRSGYGVDAAPDGPSGLRYALHNPYDVIVLDLMLPGLDGMSILRAVREKGNGAHVLILTARDHVEDRVLGLRAGADDYLVKPFSFDELLARIEALVRRGYGQKDPTIRVGPLAIDTVSRKVAHGATEVALTRREFALLEYLAFRRGQIVSRIEIEDHLYGEHDLPASNAVDRLVCALRKRIEPEGAPRVLHTRRGLGYLLELET